MLNVCIVDAKEKNSDTFRWSLGSPKLSARIEEEPNTETNGDVKDDNLSVNSAKSQDSTKKDEKESMLSKLKKLRKCKFNAFLFIVFGHILFFS